MNNLATGILESSIVGVKLWRQTQMSENQDNERLSVYPLDYADDHKEYSVQYWSNKWDNLVDLIADPYRFFKERENVFSKDDLPEGAREWKLRTPVTIIFRNATRKKEDGRKFFSLLMALEASPHNNPNVSFAAANERGREDLPAGGFLAEFAIDTRTILLTYCPPDPETIEQAPIRYQGSFSRVNVSLADDVGVFSTFGTLHFDIVPDKMSLDAAVNKQAVIDRTKANFAVSWIEDHARLSTSLEAHCMGPVPSDEKIAIQAAGGPAGQKNNGIGWYKQIQTVIASGGPAPRPITAPTIQDVPENILRQIKFKPNVQKASDPDEPDVELSRFPVLVVEGLSSFYHEASRLEDPNLVLPDPSDPCTSSVVYKAGAVFKIDTMAIKDYKKGG